MFMTENCIMDNHLSVGQILCLQLSGYRSPEILKAGVPDFNKALAEGQTCIEALLDKAAALLKKKEGLGIVTLPFYHPDFPESLKRIGDDCPPLIHLLGNQDLLHREAVAIIGARKADRAGGGAVYRWGVEYARQGKTVVSGLALGCDTAAHRGCLAAGGDTIAVVASGLDITHPKENKPLQELILRNGGLLLSEQTVGVKANPTRLIARNRLQAALSQEVVVAQCPLQSGTMHTVRFARKYGKKIYAVRFNKYDENSSGNEYLIEAGIALPLCECFQS